MKPHEHDSLRGSHRRGQAMLDEVELRALFGARRPDAARFATGVATRLHTPRRPGAADLVAGQPAAVPRRGWFDHVLDRAATVLPGTPTAGGLTKSWATWLSLPLLLVLAALAMFVRSDRSIASAMRGGTTAANHTKPWALHFMRHMPLTLGNLLALVLLQLKASLGRGVVIDAVVLAILVSMAALSFVVARYAHAQCASVVQVGGFVVELFVAALFGCVLWANGVWDGDSALGYGAIGWLLVGGIVVVGLAMLRAGAIATPLLILAVLVLMPKSAILPLPDDRASGLRQRIEAMAPSVADISGWQVLAAMVHALTAGGEPAPDLARLRPGLDAAITKGTEVHPRVWTAAAQLGLVDADQWRRLFDSGQRQYDLDQLLKAHAPWTLKTYDENQLHALLALRGLDAKQRQRMATQLDASWPQAGDPNPAGHLDRALMCLRWLELLGRRDLVLAQRDHLHTLLRRHWVSESRSSRYGFPGGFTNQPDQEPRLADVAATATAIAIIERVGAPDHLPLAHVNAFLRHAYRWSGMRAIGQEPVLYMQARADRYLLTHAIGLPARSALQVLLGERAFLAVLLLVLLGLRAVWWASRALKVAGALP